MLCTHTGRFTTHNNSNLSAYHRFRERADAVKECLGRFWMDFNVIVKEPQIIASSLSGTEIPSDAGSSSARTYHAGLHTHGRYGTFNRGMYVQTITHVVVNNYHLTNCRRTQ